MLEYIYEGIKSLSTINNLIFMNVGVFLGIVFGAIPGLGVMLAIVLLLPITFGLDSVTGIVMLLGIYCGGTYGGSISAMLLNTPGTPASAATLIDGYPLFTQGKAKKALYMAVIASTISGIVSALVLLFAAPQLAKVTLLFGPAEYFTLAVFGLSIIASVSGKNILKGLIAGALGVFISTIGLDSGSGIFRFTFNNINLAGGIELVPALIGLFAISEVLTKLNQKEQNLESYTKLTNKDRLKFGEIKKSIKTIFRSSFIGTAIGALPRAGGGIAAFISHDQAKQR